MMNDLEQEILISRNNRIFRKIYFITTLLTASLWAMDHCYWNPKAQDEKRIKWLKDEGIMIVNPKFNNSEYIASDTFYLIPNNKLTQ